MTNNNEKKSLSETNIIPEGVAISQKQFNDAFVSMGNCPDKQAPFEKYRCECGHATGSDNFKIGKMCHLCGTKVSAHYVPQPITRIVAVSESVKAFDDNTVIINRLYAETFKLDIGDYVVLSRFKNFTVFRIFDITDNITMLINDRHLGVDFYGDIIRIVSCIYSNDEQKLNRWKCAERCFQLTNLTIDPQFPF